MLWRREQKGHVHRSRIQGHLGVSPWLCRAPISHWSAKKDPPPWRGEETDPGDLGQRPGLFHESPLRPPGVAQLPTAPRSLLTTPSGGRPSTGTWEARPPASPWTQTALHSEEMKEKGSPGRPMRRIEQGPGRGPGVQQVRGVREHACGPWGWLGASPPPGSLTLPGPPSMHT